VLFEELVKVNDNEAQSSNVGICMEKSSCTSTQTIALTNRHNSSVALNVDENMNVEEASTRISPDIGSGMDLDL